MTKASRRRFSGRVSTTEGPSGYCFVLMPFRSDLDDVYDVIEKAAQQLGLACRRADKIYMAGLVLGQIFDEIRRADVVISDLTGRNPNVFYETAYAHMQKDPQQVILIAQSDDDVPFDLRPLRYLRYSNNQAGRRRFRVELREFLRQAITASPGVVIETIEGRVERTRRIAAECEALLRSGESAVSSLVVRNYAGLSALAIDDRELGIAEPADREYVRLLLRERDLCRRLIAQGAQWKLILCPPAENLVKRWDLLQPLALRYERLIAVLSERHVQPDDDCLLSDRCKFVVTVSREPYPHIWRQACLRRPSSPCYRELRSHYQGYRSSSGSSASARVRNDVRCRGGLHPGALRQEDDRGIPPGTSPPRRPNGDERTPSTISGGCARIGLKLAHGA